MQSLSVVSIGSDSAVFNLASAARGRAIAYAERLGELHIVVFSLRQHGLRESHEGPLHLYPTNSRSRLLYIFDAARMARRVEGEVVTVQDPFESGLAGLLSRRGRPLHVQLHTDLFARGFARGLNLLRLVIARVVLPRAAHVRTVSETIATQLRGRYPRVSVSVLPIFVEIARYHNVEKKPHPRFKVVLLWIGRFEREKNPELAIRALASARAAGHEVGLVMLGSGRLEQKLGELVQTLRVGEWVEFEGWQEPLPYLAQADLLLVTSHFEGYGRQIIEALAAGVPVLSTDVGVAREVGAIITTDKEFAESLNKWLTSGPRKAELKNYPYASFEEYVEKYCADIEEAVESAIVR